MHGWSAGHNSLNTSAGAGAECFSMTEKTLTPSEDENR